jgi:hypothetical protein
MVVSRTPATRIEMNFQSRAEFSSRIRPIAALSSPPKIKIQAQ